MADKGKRLIFSDGETLNATEGLAADGTIKPGMSVVHTATTIARSTSASTVFGYPHLFADYDMLHGKTVDDLWPSGDTLIVRELTQGKKANIIVTAVNSTARGIALASNGDGTLKVADVADLDYILAYTDEILNIAGVGLMRVKGA
jgi:hypothetical protein